VRESGRFGGGGYLRVFFISGGVLCKSVEVQGGYLKFPLINFTVSLPALFYSKQDPVTSTPRK
jgi:hypothetical protein